MTKDELLAAYRAELEAVVDWTCRPRWNRCYVCGAGYIDVNGHEEDCPMPRIEVLLKETSNDT